MSSAPTAPDDEVLAVPAVVCVAPEPPERKRVRAGAAAGWMVPKGIMDWSHEISLVTRADVPAIVSATRATQAHEQIAPKKFPMAKRASEASPLLPIATSLTAAAREAGVRVHTVGVDRVSAEFYYLAEGGSQQPVRVQGNLFEMLTPSLGLSAGNAEILAHVNGLIDRLLVEMSGGLFGELEVELANALPRLSRDATGLEGTSLDTFDAAARSLTIESAHLDQAARELVEALAAASRSGSMSARVPLYGEALRSSRPALQVLIGGKLVKLPAQLLWTVTGPAREDVKGASPEPPKAVRTHPPPAVSLSTATTAPTPAPPRVAAGPVAPTAASSKPPIVEPVARPLEARPAAAAPGPYPAAVTPRPRAVSTPPPAAVQGVPLASAKGASPKPPAVASPSPPPAAAAAEPPHASTPDAVGALTPAPVVMVEAQRDRDPSPAAPAAKDAPRREEPAEAKVTPAQAKAPAQARSTETRSKTDTKARTSRAELKTKNIRGGAPRGDKPSPVAAGAKALAKTPPAKKTGRLWLVVIFAVALVLAYFLARGHG
jgi:hypothetical protein